MQLIEPGTRVKLVFSCHPHTGKTATVLENDTRFESPVQVQWDDGSNFDTCWAYKGSFQVLEDQTLLKPKVDAFNGGVQFKL